MIILIYSRKFLILSAMLILWIWIYHNIVFYTTVHYSAVKWNITLLYNHHHHHRNRYRRDYSHENLFHLVVVVVVYDVINLRLVKNCMRSYKYKLYFSLYIYRNWKLNHNYLHSYYYCYCYNFHYFIKSTT
jgi:hypothetical protein